MKGKAFKFEFHHRKEMPMVQAEGGELASSPLGPSKLGIGLRRAFAVLMRGTP